MPANKYKSVRADKYTHSENVARLHKALRRGPHSVGQLCQIFGMHNIRYLLIQLEASGVKLKVDRDGRSRIYAIDENRV